MLSISRNRGYLASQLLPQRKIPCVENRSDFSGQIFADAADILERLFGIPGQLGHWRGQVTDYTRGIAVGPYSKRIG